MPTRIWPAFVPWLILGCLLAWAAPALSDAASAPARGAGAASVLDHPEDWSVTGLKEGSPWPLQEVDARSALAVGAGGVTLTSRNAVTADTEVTAVLHMGIPGQHAASAELIAGLQEGKAPSQALRLALSRAATPLATSGASADSFEWNIAGGPHWKGKAGRYNVWLLPASRVDWPRSVRMRADQDFRTLPHLDHRWVTLRLVLRPHAIQAYIDGRLVHDGGAATLETAGLVRLTLSPGMALASLKVRRLEAEDPRFEMVELDHYVNSAKLHGQEVVPDRSPEQAGLVHVGGVAFRLPQADTAGHNHIDVGRSWNRASMLSGYLGPYYSEAPRWAGAMAPDPARIQLRIRNARYTRLCLLAAADDGANTVPIVTAQFYRGSAGHPVNFAARVPLFTAQSTAADAVPIQLKDGTPAHLFLVTIPLEPNSLSAFSDSDTVELELTNQVHQWRNFPDPCYYSFHGGGLPSSAHVFALTLERPAVDVDFVPDHFAHVWTAPQQPSYTVTLHNTTAQAQTETLTLTTLSKDTTDSTTQTQAVQVPPHASLDVKLPLHLTKYGYHAVDLTVQDAQGTRTRRRSLAYLHPDTRERGDWEEGKGVIYGFWDWNGGHDTPTGLPRLQVAYETGVETSINSITNWPPEEQAFAQQHQMASRWLAYELSPEKSSLGVAWDATKPQEMAQAVVATVHKSKLSQVSPINKPDLAVFLCEPMIGQVTIMSLPEYYGDPPYVLTPQEQENYKKYLDFLLITAPPIKKEWPGARILWGFSIANFPIPFLRQSPEAAALMDGPAIAMEPYVREPELQMGLVTLHNEMWQLQQEWKKHSPKPWPHFATIEGPAVGAAIPGCLTQDEEAQNTNRTFLSVMAYNVTQINAWPNLFMCADGWGEYAGGGLSDPLPLLSPHVGLAAFATLTRQVNRMNYVKWVPTGSTSVFCLQFKHYKTGELLHVMWTLRGTRRVSMALAADQTLSVFDSMDNETRVGASNGQGTFTVTPAPCFIHGLSADAKITPGESDHSDSQPAAGAVRLTNVGDWHVTAERNDYYENVHADYIRRFPGKMTGVATRAPEAQGGQALAIHLEKQDKERYVMPYYTMVSPPKPVEIPGRASHLGVWVKGRSDWGRIAYFLRDAKGRELISVGSADDEPGNPHNTDDTHAYSQFCFDGWRYLHFELPSNLPWDSFRVPGSVWWGGPGMDYADVPELPLTLEKIAIERRTHVIYVNEFVPADPGDVEIGAIDAEYESPEDHGAEAVALSKVRMPLAELPGGDNPIAILQEQGAGEATEVQSVDPVAPGDAAKGWRVSCKPAHASTPTAHVTYDIWVARSADGRDAVRLAKDVAAPDQTVTGLSPDGDSYVFVAYRAGGVFSKPSAPFRMNPREPH